MANAIEITTVPELRKAINKATEVLGQVSFGACGDMVRITKVEARNLISQLDDDATPETEGMDSGTFGLVFANGELILG